jgi:glycosyltransferase involved in cell wall biosynthesis
MRRSPADRPRRSAHVLFLTESFAPVLGGGETHIRLLAGRLCAGGTPCTVITRRGDAAWPIREAVDGVGVRRVSPSGMGRLGKYLMVPAALRALRDEARRGDVLVVRGTRVLGLPGLVAGRALGLRVVLQPELNGELSGRVYTWGTVLDRGLGRAAGRSATAARNLLLRDADALVAMSRAIRAEFLDAGIPPERAVLIPHGVDTARFRPAAAGERSALRTRLGLPSDASIAVYTGRLLRGKGLEVLIDAFAAVAAADPRARLLIVGSGAGQPLSIEASLQAQVEAAGLAQRVSLVGRVDSVQDYLRASDVFVFPSLFEALGLSLLEASACGLPAVASRTGGIVDVVEDGASGRLVEPGSAAALAEALTGLLDDPARRSAWGTRARAIAEARFDLDASVGRYRALFAELIIHRPPTLSLPLSFDDAGGSSSRARIVESR